MFNTLGLPKLISPIDIPSFPFSNNYTAFYVSKFHTLLHLLQNVISLFSLRMPNVPFTTHSNLLAPFPHHVIPSHRTRHTLPIKRLPIPSPPLPNIILHSNFFCKPSFAKLFFFFNMAGQYPLGNSRGGILLRALQNGDIPTGPRRSLPDLFQDLQDRIASHEDHIDE